MWSNVNLALLIPTHIINIVQEIFTLIIRYNAWVNYCNIGSIFSSLDRIVNAPEAATMVVIRLASNIEAIQAQARELSQHYSDGD